jgi:hypothetical protein
MSDWELLELAAKAAGMVIEFDDEGCCMHRGMEWTPLTDDGDALRLAVKLHMDIGIWPGRCFVKCPLPGGIGDSEVDVSDSNTAAATRRAIVRAAAALAE